ncbi:HDOD domain-containing protein [Massilia horti]|uniref:HDOD domain-containing protein n=1 Tax=Massilia horti TaxID=2562153 RepID=A0A4Y9T5C8_9BURK|nr:HDOD domain-containing protein [Massilia horti]TFW32347.1 HDOD domain-containing protein [Massilia horti]
MRNWINRLLNNAGGDTDRADAGEPQSDTTGTGEQGKVDPVEVDKAFYRWLTQSAAYYAQGETEQRILDAVTDLSAAPGDAAGLVPRVPDMIPQLLRSLRDEDASAIELAQQVSKDVVLVAEVLRESNSAYYQPVSPIKTVEAAIMMLGHNGLRVLLARLAFRPIIQMQPHGFARKAAPTVWSQAEKCGLAASLLAPGLTADVFESYLAGLMQNVGLMVAFRLADQVCEDGKMPRSAEFGGLLFASSRQLSAGIARHWDFPESVADAIAQANAPGESKLAQALALGDRISKLRLLIDNFMLLPDHELVTEGLDAFQRRCLGKLSTIN